MYPRIIMFTLKITLTCVRVPTDQENRKILKTFSSHGNQGKMGGGGGFSQIREKIFKSGKFSNSE